MDKVCCRIVINFAQVRRSAALTLNSLVARNMLMHKNISMAGGNESKPRTPWSRSPSQWPCLDRLVSVRQLFLFAKMICPFGLHTVKRENYGSWRWGTPGGSEPTNQPTNQPASQPASQPRKEPTTTGVLPRGHSSHSRPPLCSQPGGTKLFLMRAMEKETPPVQHLRGSSGVCFSSCFSTSISKLMGWKSGWVENPPTSKVQGHGSLGVERSKWTSGVMVQLQLGGGGRMMEKLGLIEGNLEVKLPTKWTDEAAEMGRVREEKRRTKKIKKEKVSEKRRSRRAKRWESREKMYFSIVLWLRGRQVGSLKRRVRSHLVGWKVKNCAPLWREADLKEKVVKTLRVRGTFGRCGVHAGVARSKFGSQNVKSTSGSEHFWK